jgi:hypothetical protein
LHHKRFARIECLCVNLETPLQVVRVYAFGPAVSHFLLQTTARKLQPRFVEEIAEFVHTRHPDKDRRRIRHDPKTRLAFPPLGLSRCAFLDHGSEKQHWNR